MKQWTKWLTSSLAALTLTGMLGAVDGSAMAAQGGPGPRGGFGMGGPGAGAGLERIAQQLSLTDAQKASIRDIVRQSRQAGQGSGGSPQNMAALLIPADPNHASAVAAAKQRAADRVQQMVDTEAKIYAVLTPDQQAQLANLIANRAANRTNGKGGPRR